MNATLRTYLHKRIQCGPINLNELIYMRYFHSPSPNVWILTPQVIELLDNSSPGGDRKTANDWRNIAAMQLRII